MISSFSEAGYLTRRQFSAEDKIRIVLEGLRGEDIIAEQSRTFIIAGRKTFSRRGRSDWLTQPLTN
jgi:transposase-like protein